MARQIITSPGDYQQAIDQLLPLATSELLVFDRDLTDLGLDASARLAQLRRLLDAGPNRQIFFALRDSQPLLRRMPRLLELLAIHGHHFTILQVAEPLRNLTDAMMIADGQHALIRFHESQPRSKLLTDEADEIAPYLKRFREIQAEGGQAVTPTTLGL